MGVAGLQSYVEKYCPTAFRKVDISSLAANYTEETGHEPVVVIDTASCLTHVYNKGQWDSLNNGQLKEFGDLLIELLTNFEQLGIKVVLFSDGSPPERRIPLWLKRRREEYLKIQAVMDLLDKKQVDEAAEKAHELRPKCLWNFAFEYLKNHKFQVIQTVEEADDVILHYIKLHGCFAVLAQDSDFIICEGVTNYLSIQHLDIDKMETCVYSKNGLSRDINIDPRFLPILASMLGNDIVPPDDLREFHLRLIGDIRLASRPFIPRARLIPYVVSWIRSNLSPDMSNSEMAQRAAYSSRCMNLRHLIQKSVDSYCFPVTDPTAFEVETGHWENIKRSCHKQYVDGYFDDKLYSIVTRRKFFSGSGTEYLNKTDLPNSTFLLKSLRRRYYGILLKECSEKSGDIFVEEFIFYGSINITAPTKLPPELPDEHPGLLKLWHDQNYPVSMKWKLICWAVSDNINVEDIFKIPDIFKAPALVMYYLVNEVKPLMKKWQAEAFVAHAVRLQSIGVKQIKAMEIKVTDSTAVHLSTVYLCTCLCVYSILKACGSPTSMQMFPDYSYYDGKVFHSTYMAVKNGEDASKYCGGTAQDLHNYNNIMQFLFST